jgi:hypothetical protein
MCFGLPCMGARVRLRRELRYRDSVIPAGETGIIEEEHLAEREVTVYFPEFDVRPRINEGMLEASPEDPLPPTGTSGTSQPVPVTA